MRALIACLLVACAAPVRTQLPIAHRAVGHTVAAPARPVGYWTVGAPIPATERAPILRVPALALVIPPYVRVPAGTIDLACHAALATVTQLRRPRGVDDDTLLAALGRLVEVGRTHGDACAHAVDAEVMLQAEIHTQQQFSLRAHAFWLLAGDAASTAERRAAAYRNAALYAWHEAKLFVVSAMRDGGAFPLDPWIDAGDAFVHAGEHAHALDAYENALRASRARALSRTQAAHIARTLERLPGDRAASLRSRIAF